MNILFIGHEKNLNGASISMIDIIKEMKKDNKIYVLIPYSEGAVYEELVKEEVEVVSATYYMWCDVRASKKNWFKKRFYWYLYEQLTNIFTAKKISKYVMKNNIDIIHTNTSVINLGGLISKYTGKKHIWHIREFADADFNMYPLCNNRNYYKFMNKNADKFICVSQAVASHYDKLDKNKKIVIHDGLNDGYGKVCKENTQSDMDYCEYDAQVNILIAGRICETKGQQLVVDACEKLIDEGVDNFKLYLAGVEKEKLVIPEKLNGYVKKCGFVKDMVSLRADMDIEIVPSKYEAYGRGTAEAMAAGNPVIGRNTGGTKELITHKENGLLFNDLEELTLCMSALICDKELRQKLGQNAKDYANKEFSIKKCVDKIYDVYKS